MAFYSDDPEVDFDRWDAEQQKELEKLPLCDYCDNRIQEEFYYEINGDNICVACLEKHFRREVWL